MYIYIHIYICFLHIYTYIYIFFIYLKIPNKTAYLIKPRNKEMVLVKGGLIFSAAYNNTA